ncbi:MAG: RNA polymerase sigma factor, partial [Chloroflexi bacterium]|nr:RNA polymerase sigma factor [Chloroflexota bacterium]
MLPVTLEFQTVYETFRPRIHRYLAARVGEDAADDVAQDVFVRIYAALPGFRGESQVTTWIYRIASNAAVDWLRGSTHRDPSGGRFSVDLITEAEDERLWADIGEPSADQQVIREEMSECVQALVGRLPEAYRTALLASEEEGLKDAEAARLLGLT